MYSTPTDTSVANHYIIMDRHLKKLQFNGNADTKSGDPCSYHKSTGPKEDPNNKNAPACSDKYGSI